MSGLFPTGIRAFGLLEVRGLNLVPRPAASIMAFMVNLLNCSYCYVIIHPEGRCQRYIVQSNMDPPGAIICSLDVGKSMISVAAINRCVQIHISKIIDIIDLLLHHFFYEIANFY